MADMIAKSPGLADEVRAADHIDDAGCADVDGMAEIGFGASAPSSSTATSGASLSPARSFDR